MFYSLFQETYSEQYLPCWIRLGQVATALWECRFYILIAIQSRLVHKYELEKHLAASKEAVCQAISPCIVCLYQGWTQSCWRKTNWPRACWWWSRAGSSTNPLSMISPPLIISGYRKERIKQKCLAPVCLGTFGLRYLHPRRLKHICRPTHIWWYHGISAYRPFCFRPVCNLSGKVLFFAHDADETIVLRSGSCDCIFELTAKTFSNLMLRTRPETPSLNRYPATHKYMHGGMLILLYVYG